MSAATAASPAPIAPERQLGQDLETPRSIAERIRANGSVCFRVFGGSMFPWIRAGDILFARRCEIEQARDGEVVLFERDGRLFVHRVLRRATANSQGIARSILFTKGDALDGCDPPVSFAEFLGRVTRLNRKRRHIDLESAGQVLRGRILAYLSRESSLVYRPLRVIKRLLLA
jgi:Peptidase S24-like